jgi:hypothetical protein
MVNTKDYLPDEELLGSPGSNLQSDEEVHEDDHSGEDSSAEDASSLEGDDDHVNSVCSGENSAENDLQEGFVSSPEQQTKGMTIVSQF